MGFPPISTIGLGLMTVSSLRRVPNPPASITTFVSTTWNTIGLSKLYFYYSRNNVKIVSSPGLIISLHSFTYCFTLLFMFVFGRYLANYKEYL